MWKNFTLFVSVSTLVATTVAFVPNPAVIGQQHHHHHHELQQQPQRQQHNPILPNKQQSNNIRSKPFPPASTTFACPTSTQLTAHNGQEDGLLQSMLSFSSSSLLSSVTDGMAATTNPTSEILSALEFAPSWVLENVLTSTFFWSVTIMTSIIFLLYSWEEIVKTTRKTLPETLMPVLDSMLAEMGGLGFVGLFLGVVVTGGPLGTVMGELSENFLGDEEILLETFEFLHTALFEVAIAFFLVAGAVVGRLLSQIEYLQKFSVAVFDLDGDGDVSLSELAEFLEVDAMVVDTNGDGVLDDDEIADALRRVPEPSLWADVFMTSDQIRAETLVVRERFVDTCRLRKNFRIEDYFVPIFGEKLEEVVELSPLTWLPLVPAISLGRSIDLSHDVVSSASKNAYETCGFFLGSPEFFSISSGFAGVTLVWGVWNFWKMTKIKNMLLPTLVKESEEVGSPVVLLPPKYEDTDLRKSFNSSPAPFGWIESLFGKKATNDQEKLFGKAGANGPAMYLDSIKYQTWLVVSQIVFWGLQIVARDAQALLEGWQVQDLSLVQSELAIYGLYVSLAIGQLLLAPQTFLNYCLVSSIEELADEYVIDEAICQLEEEEMDKSSAMPNGSSKREGAGTLGAN